MLKKKNCGSTSINVLVYLQKGRAKKVKWATERYGTCYDISNLVSLYMDVTRKFLPQRLYNDLTEAEKTRFHNLELTATEKKEC